MQGNKRSLNPAVITGSFPYPDRVYGMCSDRQVRLRLQINHCLGNRQDQPAKKHIAEHVSDHNHVRNRSRNRTVLERKYGQGHTQGRDSYRKPEAERPKSVADGVRFP